MRRLTVWLTVAALALVAGCGDGSADRAAESAAPTTAPPATVDLEGDGATDDDIDQTAANALADLESFWDEQMQQVYGDEFTPPTAGYWPIDTEDDNAELPPCASSVDEVVDNMFYCFDVDAIVWDKVYLQRIADDYGDLDVALSLAHEYGHAIQAHQPPDSDRTIIYEVQADCFAGAFAGAIEAGDAPHFHFDSDGIDGVLADYVHELGDHPGTSPDDVNAHGTAFDRVVALREGYEDGVQACADNFPDDRPLTAEEFTPGNDGTDGAGNIPLDDAIQLGVDQLEGYLPAALSDVGDVEFEAPEVTEADSDCAPDADAAVAYCADANTVAYADGDALESVHEQLGDFAVVTLLAMEYGEAALAQLDHDGDDQQAFTDSVCVTGAFAGSVLHDSDDSGTGDTTFVLSPGDLDEAVTALLQLGSDQLPLLDAAGTTAFDRISAFATGVYDGLDGCGIA